MPQDELWGASARLTGYGFTYYLAGPNNASDIFSVRTFWSKQPSEDRQGNVVIDVDPAYRWHQLHLMSAATNELLGGYARNVPGVVKRELTSLREGFSEGRLQ
jgi:hypothetical protein